MSLGLDHAYRPADYRTFAAAAYRQGYRFEYRYLCNPQDRAINAHKIARREEVQIAREEGLEVCLIWQNTKNDAAGGYEAGREHGAEARWQAQLLDYPFGLTIYFAVGDYDAPLADHARIAEYLRGVNEELVMRYHVGGYGKRSVVEDMLGRRLIRSIWQSYGFSRPIGVVSPMAAVYQRKEQVTIAGVTCDVNEAFQPIGGWQREMKTMIEWFPFAIRNPAPSSLWGNYTGGPMKGVLHTTETDGFTPASSTYFGHTSYPHFTIVLNKDWTVSIYQHVPLTRSARALVNQSGGVQTNTDSAIQIEIVWRAANAPNMPRVLLDTIRALMRWLEHECGIQPHWFGGVSHYYPPENGHRLGSEPWRMTGYQWDNFNGWCGHQNVPENVHGDPGKIDVAYLMSTPEDLDMPQPLDTTIHQPAVGPGYYELEFQGGVRARGGAPFHGSMFSLAPEQRRMDPGEGTVGMVFKYDAARTKVIGYKIVTNKANNDGYDFPVS